MKKYIPYIIITILLVVISSGSTYIIMKNNDKPDIKEENKPNENKPIENDNNQVTLSEKELESYLEYVPKTDYYEDYARFNVYKTPSSINNMSEDNMINEALNILVNNDDSEGEYYEIEGLDDYTFEFKYSFDEVSALVEKMYNKKLSEPTNATFSEMLNGRYVANRALFEYYNKNFYGWVACAECGNNHVSSIVNYEVKESELIIYEYGAITSDNLGCDMPNQIIDYQNNNSLEINKSYVDDECLTDYEKNNQTLEEYFKSLTSKFTKYKHTFKKSSRGYYWYSTEVA